ncbi:hypothetical protein G7068_12135 [Leucobacter viscericola]|uniref:Uncharacterized protein n=1 Tax=Leucobacter viscericola TaxID=2714935 RepID=A0A6G7XHL0_9MICO|nr:hypothetical protein [Leucobacter viscericola]QIK63858.1 hypothetical protein G7068_12135 [Leucobacter viscericola]
MAVVEVIRTHVPSGDPVSETTVFEVAQDKWWSTEPDAVVRRIRSMRPSRTVNSCVYSFESPEHGSGWIRVSIDGSVAGVIYREQMDEKVQMLEIERVLGRKEPGAIADMPVWMYSTRLNARNPYIQFGLGIIPAYVGWRAIAEVLGGTYSDAFNKIGFFVLGLLLIGAGVALWQLGVRRFRWWHRARAVVKRRGDKMPSYLRAFE